MPAYAPVIKPGGAATFTIGGTAVHFKNFKASKAFKNEDITTNGDYDTTTELVNNRMLPVSAHDKITFDAFVDASNDVLGVLEAGNALVDNCVFTFASGKTRTYPQIALDSIDITSNVAGVNTYAVSATSNGPYTVT